MATVTLTASPFGPEATQNLRYAVKSFVESETQTRNRLLVLVASAISLLPKDKHGELEDLHVFHLLDMASEKLSDVSDLAELEKSADVEGLLRERDRAEFQTAEVSL